MGLYRSGSAYCTQCEAEGFRRITYFLDRPDVLSVYTTRIEAERAEAPVLLSNGNKIAAGDVAGTTRHFAVWHDPHPKPCYLFALVGGDLGAVRDQFVTASGRKVDLAIHVEHGKEERAAYALDALKRAMAWDEQTFGREYDLDVFNIVAVSDFNMGAMENKGLNIFNDRYVLALPQTATDLDYASIEAVIAHEYFHNWTGDRITCRDWFQLCLKEGLTVFRDQEFSSDQRSRAVKRIADVRALRAAQFPEDAGPLAHNVRPQTYFEINNFYTPTVYEKGAEIIRMLKILIGAEAFRRGMDLYFQRYDGTAATIEDFIGCFAATSGRDLGEFMRWYDQAGTPKLAVTSHYDAAARTLTLDLAQSTAPTPGQASKEPLVIPIALGLVARGGGEIALKTHGPNEADGASAEEVRRGVFELCGPARRITFLDVAAAPVASLLRGFSAPVRVEFDLGDDDLLTLLHDDSDTFNRWQAAQTRATRLLIRSVAAIRAGAAPVEDAGFLAAIAGLIAGHAADPAFTAQAVALPSEADIAREIGENVDPDAIFAARKALRRQIGSGLAEQWLELYEKNAGQHAYSPDAASAGRRACRNIALDFLAAGDPQVGSERAMAQLQNANNMTDEIAALGVLALIPGEMREHALEDLLAHPCERYAGHRQMVCVAGDDPGSGHARARARAHPPPRLFDEQSEPGARARRQFRCRKPDPVQCRRRQRLRICRRNRRRPRPEEPAGRRPPARRFPKLAHARTPAQDSRRSSPAAGRRGRATFVRRTRHRRPLARLIRGVDFFRQYEINVWTKSLHRIQMKVIRSDAAHGSGSA